MWQRCISNWHSLWTTAKTKGTILSIEETCTATHCPQTCCLQMLFRGWHPSLDPGEGLWLLCAETRGTHIWPLIINWHTKLSISFAFSLSTSSSALATVKMFELPTPDCQALMWSPDLLVMTVVALLFSAFSLLCYYICQDWQLATVDPESTWIYYWI